jgi:hypothetical protein
MSRTVTLSDGYAAAHASHQDRTAGEPVRPGQGTSGGGQNFLGVRWVARAVTSSPEGLRERMALRLLSLSPHYFYDGDIGAEAERNRRSRAALVDQIIAPYLTDQAQVIDYGCGPGYLARAVAGRAAHVDAVDISAGCWPAPARSTARPTSAT